MQRDDRGNAHSLEIALGAMVVLGSLAYVVASDDPAAPLDLGLGLLASDLMAVLEAPDAAGVPRLETLATDALHGRAVGPTFARLLPAGAGWDLSLFNGLAWMRLDGDGFPTGDVRTATVFLQPRWSAATAVAFVEGHHGLADDSLRVGLVAVERSFLATSAPEARFPNGAVAALAPRGDGVRVTAPVGPALPGDADGFAVPYDLNDTTAYAASVAAGATDAYAVGTADLAATQTTYRVEPGAALPSLALRDAFAGGIARLASPTLAPGEVVTLSYDYSALPDGEAASCRVVVTGPALGNPVADETAPCPAGAWSWTAPRHALYGAYVVDVQVEVSTTAGPVLAHDLAVFEVLPPGGARIPPTYRAALSLWSTT